MKIKSEIFEFGLSNNQIDKITSIFRAHPEIEKAIIYGSRAKGNFKNYSDIDITLMGKGLDLSIQQKVEGELDDLLLPYKIDLSILAKITNQELVNHIQRVGKNFFLRV